jgi:uncharacterized membrane protein YedE/YeeE
MHPFLAATLGGVLIGIASAWLLLFNGRIAGISGIVDGLLGPASGERSWRAAFIAGLVAGGLLLQLGSPEVFGTPVMRGYSVPVVAGLLVGFGTRLGGGCTSGHGVCGLARGSSRSFVAVMTFMVTAGLAVFLAGRYGGLR